MLDTALQATINAPPTREKNQGGIAGIFIARDTDFSEAHKLHITGEPLGFHDNGDIRIRPRR